MYILCTAGTKNNMLSFSEKSISTDTRVHIAPISVQPDKLAYFSFVK